MAIMLSGRHNARLHAVVPLAAVPWLSRSGISSLATQVPTSARSRRTGSSTRTADGTWSRMTLTATVCVSSAWIASWNARLDEAAASEPPERDGSAVVRHRVADPGWIVRHVLQYAGDAVVEEPEEARGVDGEGGGCCAISGRIAWSGEIAGRLTGRCGHPCYRSRGRCTAVPDRCSVRVHMRSSRRS